jgi:3-mercaptopyruvate sulfurtransferase SseA/sterol desaturase/sphingolipid hydroxylase (fatty acid hydroxylase superfamily)
MRLIFLFLFLLGIFGQIQGQQGLIQAAELNNIISSDTLLVVVDIRDAEAFGQGHIPGAVNISSRSKYGCDNCEIKGMMIEKSEFEILLGSLGVHPESKIVIYDDRCGANSARLWFILREYGHEKVQLLNGGIGAWFQEDHELETSADSIIETKYVFPKETPSNALSIDLDEMLIAMNDPNTVLLDTRTIDEYEGSLLKDKAARAGRIPGSVFVDWASSVNYDSDEKFKDSVALSGMFELAGITKDKTIITYCQSGTRSAHSLFTLTQILGYENVRNYDGSWIEWSGRADLATETGAIPIPKTYWQTFSESFWNFFSYTLSEITFSASPGYVNYFWMLTLLSLVVWGLEALFPWRKNQPIIRKDFWLDAFYMYFNFYIFKIIIFAACSNVVAYWFTNMIGGDIESLALFDMSGLHWAVQLLIFFVGVDFIQWFTHVMLHRFGFLWRFHKVHHSVEQMGFAAHLRYHWMENVFYTPMKFLMMMFIGNFDPEQAFVVYYVSIAIGHLNHANINLSYGPLKYIFNNPKMHIWHHAEDLPEARKNGVNFGISLSIWDYIFRTNYIPSDGRDIKLGFEGLENYPKSFFGQLFSGFQRNKK